MVTSGRYNVNCAGEMKTAVVSTNWMSMHQIQWGGFPQTNEIKQALGKKKEKKNDNVWPHAVHETSTLWQTLLKYKKNWYIASNVLAQNRKWRASSQVTDMFTHT